MEEKIDKYIKDAESYIHTHPDTTGTTKAMIALTISIQQIENQTKELKGQLATLNKSLEDFNENSSDISWKIMIFTAILVIASIINIFF